jgi:CO/xanthine dehydrogenase Mo-binding subunit
MTKSSITMDAPFADSLLDQAARPRVGTAHNRIDGPLKVSGRAPYAAEHFPDGLAHGVLLRAPFGKGRVIKLDTSAAEAMAGVLEVVTDDRLIRNGGDFAGAAAPAAYGTMYCGTIDATPSNKLAAQSANRFGATATSPSATTDADVIRTIKARRS